MHYAVYHFVDIGRRLRFRHSCHRVIKDLFRNMLIAPARPNAIQVQIQIPGLLTWRRLCIVQAWVMTRGGGTAPFNRLGSVLWSRYWLRFQDSYENVISSLKTSSATSPAPSGNVIISRSSSTLSLTSHISIFILPVVLLYPIPRTQLLSKAVFTDYKRSWGEKRHKATKKKEQTKKIANKKKKKRSRDGAVKLRLIMPY